MTNKLLLTEATVSPSAAAFRFSRAFCLAVVERTAVATFVTASFLGGFVGEGYANKLGFALEWNSNVGAYKVIWSVRQRSWDQ